MNVRYGAIEQMTGAEVYLLVDLVFLEKKKTDGTLKIAMAGSEPVFDSGEIIKLTFQKLAEEAGIKIKAVIVNETEITASPEIESQLPDHYDLNQNYPNPFNSETIIKYQLPEDSHVEVSIYNVLGQRVRRLVYEDKKGGYYRVSWNGRNDSGVSVASGLYIVKMKARNFFKTRKMIYLR